MLYTITLWWPHKTNSLVLAAARTCSLPKPSWSWSALAMAGAYKAYSSEQRRGLSAAARWLECARGTDKALGESQLSRPLTTATPTPSTGVCAPPMCRHPCTSALARMLTRKGSGRGHGRPPPMRWPQRGGPRGCGQRIGGGLRLPQPEEKSSRPSRRQAELYNRNQAPLCTPYP